MSTTSRIFILLLHLAHTIYVHDNACHYLNIIITKLVKLEQENLNIKYIKLIQLAAFTFQRSGSDLLSVPGNSN